jgi:hypothetical protein
VKHTVEFDELERSGIDILLLVLLKHPEAGMLGMRYMGKALRACS